MSAAKNVIPLRLDSEALAGAFRDLECDIRDVETAVEITASLLEDCNGSNDSERTDKLMRYAVYHAREVATKLARAYFDVYNDAFKKPQSKK
jgi:hypothetical protein